MEMQVQPSLSRFTAKYEGAQPQFLWTKLPADFITPMTAYVNLHGESDYDIFLESVEAGRTRGRYSIIALDPDIVWSCTQKSVKILDLESGSERIERGNPSENLRRLLATSQIKSDLALPSMVGGLFGYLGYEFACLEEPTASLRELHDDKFDVGMLARMKSVVIFDSVFDEIIVCRTVRPKAGVSAEQAYRANQSVLQRHATLISQPVDLSKMQRDIDAQFVEPQSNYTPDEYRARVRKAVEYIHAGDVFQATISQTFSTEFKLPSLSLYRQLRRLNPAPYMFHLSLPDKILLGASPETMVKLSDGTITICPIAGTRPRGATSEQDLAHEVDLLSDEKELAEHLMLLDLARNDVGKVSDVGSISLRRRFDIARYSRVMHIESEVTGRLRDEFSALDALLAGFPAGTVSGAPKIRAMQIIEELEQNFRHAYGGGVGYFTTDGNMDFCIALRTAAIEADRIEVRAGAGIVADSVDSREDEECHHKARGLFEAIRFCVEDHQRAREKIQD